MNTQIINIQEYINISSDELFEKADVYCKAESDKI